MECHASSFQRVLYIEHADMFQQILDGTCYAWQAVQQSDAIIGYISNQERTYASTTPMQFWSFAITKFYVSSVNFEGHKTGLLGQLALCCFFNIYHACIAVWCQHGSVHALQQRGAVRAGALRCACCIPSGCCCSCQALSKA